jgi:hypothetical protein
MYVNYRIYQRHMVFRGILMGGGAGSGLFLSEIPATSGLELSPGVGFLFLCFNIYVSSNVSKAYGVPGYSAHLRTQGVLRPYLAEPENFKLLQGQDCVSNCLL